MRFVELIGTVDVTWPCTLCALFGFVDALLKVDTEADIKKIVAYQTVCEMHICVIYVLLDYEAFVDLVLFTMPAHC
jgi:predicted transcriptional regulator